MVLINQLFIGLLLLVSSTQCSASTTTTTQPPSTSPTSPTTSPPTTQRNHRIKSRLSTIKNATTTATTPVPPEPKTEPEDFDFSSFPSGTTSTETPDEKRKIAEGDGSSRRESARALAAKVRENNVFAEIPDEKRKITDGSSRNENARALDAKVHENNVFAESKSYAQEKDYDKIFDNIQLTTPGSHGFDSRHKEIQEDVDRMMGEREKMIGGIFDNDHKYFYNKSKQFSEPPESDYKVIEEFKKIEASESKTKNKIHKDSEVEIGKKMELIRSYNETKEYEEPRKINTTKADISQNEVKDDGSIKDKKLVDLVQESSDQISEIQVIEKLKLPENREQLDPIPPNDKEININKRGRPRNKSKTSSINLEERNIVEVTTKAKITEDPLYTSTKEVEDLKLKEIETQTTTVNEEITTVLISTASEEETSGAFETTQAETEVTSDETTEQITTETKVPIETTTQLPETTNTETTLTTASMDFDESRTNFRGLIDEFVSNITEVDPDDPISTTPKKYDDEDDEENMQFYEATTIKNDTDFYAVSTEKPHKTNDLKKNETVSNIANEIFKSALSSTESNEVRTVPSVDSTTHIKPANTTKFENEIIKQNEINVTGDKLGKPSTTEEPIEKDCINLEHCDDKYDDEELEDVDDHSEKIIVSYEGKVTLKPSPSTGNVDSNKIEFRQKSTHNFSTPRFKTVEEIDVEVTTNSAGLVDTENVEEEEGNGGKIAAIVISTVGGVCLFLLVGLLIVMRKRQKRFNYGQRCRPVSLDAYSMDNVSIHNSTRRKGVLMTSKRAYGNAAFEDPNSPSHPLTFAELIKFSSNTEEIQSEFEEIPQVQAKTSELPEGCEVKNRYANVIPLPETRVFLSNCEGDPTSNYINANFVTGAKSERRYYIACQAPLQNTISDFWRMVWEQESKVILMLTHLYEQGVEKCIDYLPPSEVLDCHRLFGDFQVTLKKREVRDKYIISSLQLKNMVSNSWREVTHLWYVEWPHKGVPEEANSLIRFLIEARSYMKANEIKIREANTSFIQGTVPRTPPVIVHCSPGTGRTGTVIACDIAIREFEQSRQVDIPKIVYKIRRDRASSVQTKEQYSFIYKVINLYATKLSGGAFDSF